MDIPQSAHKLCKDVCYRFIGALAWFEPFPPREHTVRFIWGTRSRALSVLRRVHGRKRTLRCRWAEVGVLSAINTVMSIVPILACNPS